MKRILLVDDSPTMLKLVGSALAGLGEVETRLSAAEALHSLNQRDFDMLITDHEMPAVNGMRLIEKARAGCPQLKCLMISGRVDESGEDWLRDHAVPWVIKPFNLMTFRQLVMEALSA